MTSLPHIPSLALAILCALIPSPPILAAPARAQDPPNPAVTTLTDPDHDFVRTERIPAFMRDMVPLPSGHMVVNSTIRTAEGVDWPLQRGSLRLS